jgi:hypothetical protein
VKIHWTTAAAAAIRKRTTQTIYGPRRPGQLATDLQAAQFPLHRLLTTSPGTASVLSARSNGSHSSANCRAPDERGAAATGHRRSPLIYRRRHRRPAARWGRGQGGAGGPLGLKPARGSPAPPRLRGAPPTPPAIRHRCSLKG